MSWRLLVMLLCLWNWSSFGQTVITGDIKDKKNVSIPFANVYLEDGSDGGISDENGTFSFETSVIGEQVLVVSVVGYQTYRKDVKIVSGKALKVRIQLEVGTTLSEVVVSAGVFDASDEKKATILKPLDIVTNPGASGDIYGALATLPGIASIQNETGLFVRGGEASETKTIIDGTLVSKPFFGEAPDIPSRGRFNPFLFKGTMFSTGGYSARYGQALSSVLILDTENVPNRNKLNVGVNMAGISTAFVNVWNQKSTALLGNFSYSNLSPLFSIVPQNRNWILPPTGIDGAVGFRNYSEKGNLFKSYLQYQKGKLELGLDDYDNPSNSISFQNENQNLFWNNMLKGRLGEEWKFLAVGSFSYDKDVDRYDEQINEIEEYLGQARLSINRKLGGVEVRVGNETQLVSSYYKTTKRRLNNNYTAFFAEGDIKLSNKLAWRIGTRTEYASILDRWNVMPRTSLSYRMGNNGLVSMAYGQFYQTPNFDYLLDTDNLNFEKATHYIANYQWKKDNRIFRIEAYYKDYEDLVLLENNVSNKGFGFSKGVDFFWRDQQTIPNLTYWISYSWLNSERHYKNFPTKATPTFVSDHTLSIVGNYHITPRTRVGAGYTFASGRPYENPNNTVYLADKTPDFHNLNFSGSYLFSLLGNFSVVYVSLKNPFQLRQISGYRYSEDGIERFPILPSSNWSVFAGISITLRRKK